MHIVFAASECVPFAKTGGLADVVGALPPELVKLGHEVTVYLPLYARRAATDQGRAEARGHAPSPFLSSITTASWVVVDGGKRGGCAVLLYRLSGTL
jgi:starch synthase